MTEREETHTHTISLSPPEKEGKIWRGQRKEDKCKWNEGRYEGDEIERRVRKERMKGNKDIIKVIIRNMPPLYIDILIGMEQPTWHSQTRDIPHWKKASPEEKEMFRKLDVKIAQRPREKPKSAARHTEGYSPPCFRHTCHATTNELFGLRALFETPTHLRAKIKWKWMHEWMPLNGQPASQKTQNATVVVRE